MSRCYTAADEENVRVQGLVSEWEQSGLLDKAQADRMNAELRVDLRRTNNFLRAVFFFFTVVIVAACVALVFTTFRIRDEAGTGALFLVSAVACFAAAGYIVGTYKLYRFGIEEALASGSAVLLAAAAWAFAVGPYYSSGDFPFFVALAGGAVGAWLVYQRFGFWYAAVACLLCVAGLPSQAAWPDYLQRLSSGAMLLAAFVLVGRRLRSSDDFRALEYELMRAAAWASMYVALNLRLGWHTLAHGPFYWFSYVTIWVLPIVGLSLGLRGKERPLMAVSVVTLLATLATNKPYLGLERQSWDPILLGVVLVTVAVVLRRWLANGAGGQRYGFTPFRILASEERLFSAAITASAATQPQPAVSQPAAPSQPQFGGGASGGGGASSDF